MTPQRTPLKRYPFLATDDIYVARKKRAKIWGRFSSRVEGQTPFFLVHNRADIRHSSLHFFRCNAAVRAWFDRPHDRYWLQLPFDGHIEMTINGRAFSADSTTAVVQGPWEQYRFRATPCEGFFYGLDSALVHRVLPEGFRGHFAYSLAGMYRNILEHLLIGLSEALDEWAMSYNPGCEVPAVFTELESAVGTCIAEGIRDSLAGNRNSARIGDTTMASVRTFMCEESHQSLSVGDIARAAGVSIRTLQKAFSEHYSLTPLEVLKIIRLDNARHLLQAIDGPKSVGEVCRVVGIGHTGRFSRDYTRRFAESPSETLQHRGRRESSGPTMRMN